MTVVVVESYIHPVVGERGVPRGKGVLDMLKVPGREAVVLRWHGGPFFLLPANTIRVKTGHK